MAQFEVDPKRFEVHKETLTRQLKNFHAKQPYRCCGMCVCVCIKMPFCPPPSHAMYYAGALLVHPFWTNSELEQVIDGGQKISLY